MAGRLTRCAERPGTRSSAYGLPLPRQCLTLPPRREEAYVDEEHSARNVGEAIGAGGVGGSGTR